MIRFRESTLDASPSSSSAELTLVHACSSRRLQGLEPQHGLLPERQRTMKQTPPNVTAPAPAHLVVNQPKTPKTFLGAAFEDADDWLEHFERVVVINDWTPDILVNRLGRSLLKGGNRRKKFLEKKRFQQHMVLMHASMLTENDYATMTLVKKLHCSQCAYVTYSSKSFRQHEVTHTGKYPHICNECNKGFTFRFELTKHVRCVHQAQFFRCESCKRTFTAEETYKIHKEHHDRGLGFTCTECGNMYETQGHYEQHMQAHSSDLPYECPICNKRFALTRSLNLHRLSHDKQRTPRPRPYNGNRNWDYYCELCNVFYKYGSSLVAHRVCVHGNGPTTTCPYCEKKFNSRLTLSMHIRMHTRERPMRCSYCGKTFRVWNSLKRHVVTSHTKDFKLFCPLCNKGFVSRSYLKVHLKSAHKAVMSGPGKRKRLPDGPAVAQHPPARTTTVQKPPVIIPMPAKLDRSTLAPQARRPRHHPAKAASVSITPVATQLPMVHPPTQVDAPQRPQQPPQPQQLPLERPELQQQAQLQQLHLQQLQLQPSQMHPQHLQPSRQHAQQRDLFEMQQIPHLETDTYSLMLLCAVSRLNMTLSVRGISNTTLSVTIINFLELMLLICLKLCNTASDEFYKKSGGICRKAESSVNFCKQPGEA
ncbi:hypothetical protein HPB51_024943 [Rhipicephalus microplus]|uniref:C2H2-type domain-containing protein n=1 Tax=Rhipicephalus microplus TaxID=6941 RepID=A0A9J6DDT1_RHIMP|nr:hypothetical protein HPB51_024943 [Rhipicephalus microplus]